MSVHDTPENGHLKARGELKKTRIAKIKEEHIFGSPGFELAASCQSIPHGGSLFIASCQSIAHGDAMLIASIQSIAQGQPVELNADAPDGGWGWLVLIASIFNFTLIWGLAYVFGILYIVFEEYFETERSKIAIIGSLFMATFNVGSPVASMLCNKIGHRKVIIIGGGISAVGLFVSAWAPNIYFLYVSYGFVTGKCPIY